MKKYAVCLYGFLRTYKIVSESLINHILKPNNADLFIFAPNNTGISVIPKDIDINEYKRNNHKELKNQDLQGEIITNDELIKTYSPYLKNCLLYEYNQKKFFDRAASIETLYDSLIPKERVCSLLYNISGSVKLLIDYCENNNIQYDGIILVRPDLALYNDLNLENIDLQKINIPIGGGILNVDSLMQKNCFYVDYYKNAEKGILFQYNKYKFTDQLIISSYQNFVCLSQLFENIDEYVNLKLPFHPETILFYELCYKQKIKSNPLDDVLYEIFRNNYSLIENGLMYSSSIKPLNMQNHTRKKLYVKRIIVSFLFPVRCFFKYFRKILVWLLGY